MIEPHQTRPKLIRALRTLQTKRVEQPEAQARQHPAVGRIVGRNGKHSPPRPQLRIQAANASPDEAAAIAAALEQFLHDVAGAAAGAAEPLAGDGSQGGRFSALPARRRLGPSLIRKLRLALGGSFE